MLVASALQHPMLLPAHIVHCSAEVRRYVELSATVYGCRVEAAHMSIALVERELLIAVGDSIFERSSSDDES